jgi:opacity protein-like surface antigen
MRSKPLLFVLSLVMVLTTAVAARAEWFLDAYLGPAFTQNGNFKNGPAASATTKFDTVFSLGGRGGYYFESLPYLGSFPYLGLALDLSHYQPDGSFGGGGSGFRFDTKVTALSLDAMLRLPLLTSKDFPKGRLQPYLSVGPGLYFSHMKINPTPVFGSSDSDTSVGVKAAAGATWLLTQRIGLLAEYRFSHFNANYLGFDADVNSHRLQFGATLRF